MLNEGPQRGNDPGQLEPPAVPDLRQSWSLWIGSSSEGFAAVGLQFITGQALKRFQPLYV